MTLRNLETRRIPVGMGLHPYFANRRGATLAADLPTRWNWDEQLMPTHSEPNLHNAQFRRGIAATSLPVAAEYCDWTGEARIDWPAEGISVRLVTQPALGHVVIWAPVGEDFFCFEPLSHATDSFNRRGCTAGTSGVGSFILEPGALVEQAFSFIVNLEHPPESS
jgi:aldose 1-epimerase